MSILWDSAKPRLLVPSQAPTHMSAFHNYMYVKGILYVGIDCGVKFTQPLSPTLVVVLTTCTILYVATRVVHIE
jgi:hypothetical protein